MAREQHPHPAITVRKPKENSGKLTSVLDVSDDVDQLADTDGEFTGATLAKPGMPQDFTICGAFRTEAWTTAFSGTRLFQLTGKNGKMWGYLGIFAAYTYT